jgi:MFS family permease
MIVTYQLYILQDYIKLGDDAVGVIPLIGLVNLAAIIVATPIAGILSDKFHRRKVIVFVAGVLLALGMVFPVVMPTVTGMILYSIVGGLGFGAWSSVDFALVSEVLPSSDDVGKDLGIINITSTLPQTMAAAFASVIVALFGGFAGLFIVAALCVLAGAALVAPIKSIR